MESEVLGDIHNFEVEYADFLQSKKAEEPIVLHQEAQNECTGCTSEVSNTRSFDACVSFEPSESLPSIEDIMSNSNSCTQNTEPNDGNQFKIPTDEVSKTTAMLFKKISTDFICDLRNW